MNAVATLRPDFRAAFARPALIGIAGPMVLIAVLCALGLTLVALVVFLIAPLAARVAADWDSENFGSLSERISSASELLWIDAKALVRSIWIPIVAVALPVTLGFAGLADAGTAASFIFVLVALAKAFDEGGVEDENRSVRESLIEILTVRESLADPADWASARITGRDAIVIHRAPASLLKALESHPTAVERALGAYDIELVAVEGGTVTLRLTDLDDDAEHRIEAPRVEAAAPAPSSDALFWDVSEEVSHV